MSIVLFLSVMIIFALGYRVYGRFAEKIVSVRKQNQTPAFYKQDNTDFIPAKNRSILFGHHFASIAGAGPIVGPVVAYMWWGWLGALLWIVLGCIFFGAVHDFFSLIISVREGGISIGKVAEKYISSRAGKLLLIFLWCALVIVIAVFASLCARSFVSQPEVILPSLGLIPVAVLVGFLLYVRKMKTFLATMLGLSALTVLVICSKKFAFSLPVSDPYFVWMCLLFVYAFFASVLPVNILLQPRDYLSSFLLFFGVAVSVIAFLTRPLPLSGAEVFTFFSQDRLPLFPLMFITVACGAISGFHSLVSSGTSSKQLARETDARPIGYGAMITEGVLAVIALFAVAFGLRSIPQGKTPVEIFAQGFGNVVYFLGDYGRGIALVMLNAFILTTLDTATRITRFLTQEFFGLSNKWLSTGLVVSAAAFLGLKDKWQALWPLFGASNQLVAALALIVISAWLIKNKKNYKIALIPALVMLLITFSALIFNAINFYARGKIMLSLISALLLVMSGIVLTELRHLKRAGE